jgi:hypothetical protein
MKRPTFIILFLLCIFASEAQTNKPVVIVRMFKTEDNRMLVEYKIPDAKDNEIFELDVSFYDLKKTKYTVFTISGDYPIVTGGNTKFLYWDVMKDRQDFPVISSAKIEIISMRVLKEKDPINKMELPETSEKSRKEQVGNTTQKNLTKNNKNHVTPQKATTKRKKFTAGVYGGYGYGTLQEIKSSSVGAFTSANGGEFFYGGFFVFSHFGIDLSSTERIFSDDDNTFNLSINSLNLSLDYYTDMPASPKKAIGFLLGFGAGKYTTTFTDEKQTQTTLRKDEIAYYPKLGVIINISKYFKISITDSYHFANFPVNDFKVAISIGI